MKIETILKSTVSAILHFVCPNWLHKKCFSLKLFTEHDSWQKVIYYLVNSFVFEVACENYEVEKVLKVEKFKSNQLNL